MTFEYTKEIVADMVETYNAAREDGYDATVVAVEVLAERYGITVGRVRAKLVNLDEVEYLTKPKTRKTVATKDKLVAALAEALEIDEETLDTMAKATKTALVKVFGKVNALREEAGRDTVAIKD